MHESKLQSFKVIEHRVPRGAADVQSCPQGFGPWTTWGSAAAGGRADGPAEAQGAVGMGSNVSSAAL